MRAVSGIVLLAVCGAVLVGCGNNAAPETSSAASGGAVRQMPAPANSDVQSSGGGSARAAQPQSQPLPLPGRQVVRTATIAVRVTNLDNAEGDVRQIAASAGGYAGQEDDESGQASFTLQVPQAKLDGVLDQLSHLGATTSRTEQAQDVTNELVDVQSRLASQQASVARVRALMDRATSIGDVVSIEGELTKREADLESLEQQQAELSSQVAMSAVTVRLTRTQAAVVASAPPPSGFLGGLNSGWHAFLGALSVLLVVLGAVLPFVVVLGGLGALAWWLRRRRRPAAPAAVAGGED